MRSWRKRIIPGRTSLANSFKQINCKLNSFASILKFHHLIKLPRFQRIINRAINNSIPSKAISSKKEGFNLPSDSGYSKIISAVTGNKGIVSLTICHGTRPRPIYTLTSTKPLFRTICK